MRNKITPAEAVEIGARIRAARLRANKSIIEVGHLAGVHHSQVSRCERGNFKTVSKNVQKMCMYLQITHPKLESPEMLGRALSERFDALLKSVPGSAIAFSRLFDVLESSTQAKAAHTRPRRKRPGDSSSV